MEELGDVPCERSAAAVRDAEPSAQPVLHLRVHEPVRDRVLRLQERWDSIINLRATLQGLALLGFCLALALAAA